MADERRLTTRMIATWKTVSQAKGLPRRADLRPETFGADAPHCFYLALDAALPQSRLLYVGDRLRPAVWAPETHRRLTDYLENSLVRLTAAKIPAALAKGGPISFGGTGVRDVTAILYRAILLPLADDGETIDCFVGAINFRDISAVQEYGEEPMPPPPAAPDRVEAYIAFSSRRVTFAPSVAKKPMLVTIK
ncbi:MAG TPA: hypothetical protein VIJ78_11210 [Pseudolabrys sp.]